MIFILKYIFAFGLGLIESFGLQLETKFLQKNSEIPTCMMIGWNTFLWFVVFDLSWNSMEQWWLRWTYIIGMVLGGFFAIKFDKKLDALAKFKGIKISKKKYKRKKK